MNSGNALEASNALTYRVWGIPGNALRAFQDLSGVFQEFLPESRSRTGDMAHSGAGLCSGGRRREGATKLVNKLSCTNWHSQRTWPY